MGNYQARFWRAATLVRESLTLIVNAALNIRNEGLRILALGTSATASGGKVSPKGGRRKSSVSKVLPVEAGSPTLNDPRAQLEGSRVG
ncbi:hypothetical protein [Microcoleus sp. CAWBG58]|uniref:hypothetical protein n=1 Tax=Microcoleus sp. CAWBG58 TaxID=2841651 RepID=UPI00345DDEE9